MPVWAASSSISPLTSTVVGTDLAGTTREPTPMLSLAGVAPAETALVSDTRRWSPAVGLELCPVMPSQPVVLETVTTRASSETSRSRDVSATSLDARVAEAPSGRECKDFIGGEAGWPVVMDNPCGRKKDAGSRPFVSPARPVLCERDMPTPASAPPAKGVLGPLLRTDATRTPAAGVQPGVRPPFDVLVHSRAAETRRAAASCLGVSPEVGDEPLGPRSTARRAAAAADDAISSTMLRRMMP